MFINEECPHCGNEISVNTKINNFKCKFCRRMVKAVATKHGRKIKYEIVPIEFSTPYEKRGNK